MGPVRKADALAPVRKRLVRAFASVADKGLKFGAHVPMPRNAFLVAIHTTFVVGQAADLRGLVDWVRNGFGVSDGG
jgi:hypothetical protein